jgi:uncharacterized protein YbbK (DUF523 family)
MKIAVSACLLGENCKYNGGNNLSGELARLLEGHTVIPVCPEVLGGLPVPRVPAEIVDGTVMNREGTSVDAAFRRGAEKALETVKSARADLIILQPRSPSCGVKQVYDGTFSGTLIPGQGVFAELASRSGFRVADAEDVLSDRILRIMYYEGIMDRIREAAEQAETDPEALSQALPELRELEAYYSGSEWKEDFAADEAGLLPEGLKRGVLSQDGVWNLLERFRETGQG